MTGNERGRQIHQAKEIAKSKSEFLVNMSHEIRTPMNAIIGLSHLALNHPVSSEIRHYLEKINASSESLTLHSPKRNKRATGDGVTQKQPQRIHQVTIS